MFIVSLHYIVDLDIVDSHMDAHVAWLKEGLADGWLLVAGRKVPREGGILIARGNKADIDAKVLTDPFVINGAAEVTVTEFNPSFLASGLEFLKT
ncbi:GTP cyclohydrolase [Sphingobium sp. SCG-1]|uniref:YciI family protein n=1 Tax=Sphingobium sp. SCG-1 TaxID=2072936 RepID=UPI000CD6AE2F|nr:YciI family protein [Sphingobium sp. SCG-1]AUW56828.1 GTP cyclohydrolase [Sphingobium sp. SCG-1]